MTKICSFDLTEISRNQLASALGVLNVLWGLASLALVGIAAYLRIRLIDKVHLVEDYNVDTLPIILITTGFLSLVIHLFGGGLLMVNNYPDNRLKTKNLLYVYLVVEFVICIVVFSCGILCFRHVTFLKTAFHGGLTIAMDKYQVGKEIKQRIDELQMQYHCCGSNTYTDWFRVDWIPEVYYADFDISRGKGGNYRSHDHVPFSCCDMESKRPCVNSDVHNNARHIGYDYTKDVTVYTIGCRDALITYLGKILRESGAVILSIFAVQLMLLFMFRFLQTSINVALARGPGHGGDTTPGFLCAWKEPPEVYQPILTVEDPQDIRGKGDGFDDYRPVISVTHVSERGRSKHSRLAPDHYPMARPSRLVTDPAAQPLLDGGPDSLRTKSPKPSPFAKFTQKVKDKASLKKGAPAPPQASPPGKRKATDAAAAIPPSPKKAGAVPLKPVKAAPSPKKAAPPKPVKAPKSPPKPKKAPKLKKPKSPVKTKKLKKNKTRHNNNEWEEWESMESWRSGAMEEWRNPGAGTEDFGSVGDGAATEGFRSLEGGVEELWRQGEEENSALITGRLNTVRSRVSVYESD